MRIYLLALLLFLAPAAWADGVDFKTMNIRHNVSRNGVLGMDIQFEVLFQNYAGESMRAEVYFTFPDKTFVMASGEGPYSNDSASSG